MKKKVFQSTIRATTVNRGSHAKTRQYEQPNVQWAFCCGDSIMQRYRECYRESHGLLMAVLSGVQCVCVAMIAKLVATMVLVLLFFMFSSG